MTSDADLPDDVDTLKAMLRVSMVEFDGKLRELLERDAQIRRMAEEAKINTLLIEKQLSQLAHLRREKFGASPKSPIKRPRVSTSSSPGIMLLMQRNVGANLQQRQSHRADALINGSKSNLSQPCLVV
jgi:hypothetical protein